MLFLCDKWLLSEQIGDANTAKVRKIWPPNHSRWNISFLQVKAAQTNQKILAYACQGCNGSKYVKTEAPDPITKIVVPLFNPRVQNWNDHFSWGKIFTIVVGITPTGRATVFALKLNRKKLVMLREALVFFGTHPPEIV